MEKMPNYLILHDRFWAKVNKTKTCWLWIGAINTHGYGNFYAEGIFWSAHRFAYTRSVGKIPKGYDIDHLCRVRNCVNPKHLEPVTRSTNLLRGETIVAAQHKQTSCIHGHEFNKRNTYVDKRGRRHCRRCRVIRNKQYRKNNA